ncbi:MAG: NUDIX hydrolase [Aquiluna sp.]|nr:NUDIX hydrolase [Aquiluna sp.]MCF8545712.1 NUDIX hydrolase [Aquiluna sp.]
MKDGQVFTVSEISAGGLVVSSENPRVVALISHKNRGGQADWCIPKGHVEKGEDLTATAVREVFEETGIEGKIIEKIGEISYTFRVGKKRIQKTVHHFLLEQTGGELSHLGDPTGEVLDVKWFELEELASVLAHENERKVATKAMEILN